MGKLPFGEVEMYREVIPFLSIRQAISSLLDFAKIAQLIPQTTCCRIIRCAPCASGIQELSQSMNFHIIIIPVHGVSVKFHEIRFLVEYPPWN